MPEGIGYGGFVKRESKNDTKLEVIQYQVGAPGYRDVANYDERYTGSPNEYRQVVMERAYRGLICDLKGKHLLDVGCGSGRGIVRLAPDARFAAGCDASLDMLAVTARKLNGANNWGLAKGLAQQLPFSSSSFDVVISLNFLHLFSLETQRHMIREMKRVAKPGGTLVLEFDNALHGLCVVGLFKRFFGDERGTLPWEARYVLGEDCRILSVRSAVIPIAWRLFHRAPAVFLTLERVCDLPVLNRVLGHRIYYQLKKN